MRIRTIKPEFFLHFDLWEAEREAQLPLRVAFAGLWCAADRRGRFKWRPQELKARILPYDDCDFSRVLHALTTRGFLVRYASNGTDFGWIPSFETHQVINNRERESILPNPCDATSSTRDPRVTHACPTPLNLDQGEGKGREGNKEQGREDGSASTPHPQPEATDRPVEELPLEDGSAGKPQDESDPPVRGDDPTTTPKTPHAKRTEAARGILDHLNTRAGRAFRPSDQYLKAIDARLAEVKGDVSGVLAMIDRQVALWAHDPQMAECLNPVTLFRPSKFPRYYDDRNRPITAPGARNGCAGARPHRNDFVGTPESRAAWAAQCAAADERLVEGY